MFNLILWYDIENIDEIKKTNQKLTEGKISALLWTIKVNEQFYLVVVHSIKKMIKFENHIIYEI